MHKINKLSGRFCTFLEKQSRAVVTAVLFFDSKNLSLLKKSIFIKIEEILYPYKNALWALRPCKAFGRSISASLPKPQTPSPREGAECGAAALTKQGRLKSVAHSRCTTQRHQRLTTRIGATPKARTLWLLAKSFARCKTNIASNAKHPFLKKYIGFFDGLKIFFLTILQVSEIRK